MQDTKLRKALEDLRLIASAEFPTIGLEWRRERLNEMDRRHYALSVKLDMLFNHLGLRYVDTPGPVIEKIKREGK